MGQKDLFPADVKAIQSQIETKIENLNKKNNIQEITENKKDINTYITKKSKIAGELSGAGSYIKELMNEKEKIENELQKNSEYVKAPISGVVSYRVDNLEDVLTPEKFESLTKDSLDKLELKTGQIVGTSNEMGKIINNYECFIAAVIKSKEAKEAEVGQKVLLRLSNQEEIKATIVYVNKEKDGSNIVVFRINEAVEKLIDYRKVSMDVIWWKYEGLKAPKSAIIYDNGLSYVVRNRGGYKTKILVKIVKESSNYCVIDNYTYEELQELGYSSSDINKMREISIYDELVVNPQIEDIK